MNKELSELQLMMLDMMKWFHAFCQKNNIKYYVVGGTMLGAARHQGFIPWDDDIDVGIPRKDYERLIKEKNELFKNEQRYSLESFKDNNSDFEYMYAKVYDTHTTLVENCKRHTKRGIFIDVFPLDGIGSGREEAISNYTPILRKINILMTRTCEVRKGRSVFKNAAIILSQVIPSFILNNNNLIQVINDMCSARDFDSYEYVGNLLGNWGKKEIMPRKFFGKPTLYKFEDTQVYGPEDYDGYLSNVYNNWRQLPPVEKQKSQHDFLMIDLKRGYLE